MGPKHRSTEAGNTTAETATGWLAPSSGGYSARTTASSCGRHDPPKGRAGASSPTKSSN